jgi:DNA invertase Pin-like site-specific DNA recombinase
MEIHNKYGYVRVSSKSQESNSSIESQKQELIKNRPVFQKLIKERLKANDLLMVTKIDRCSRNTLEFLKLEDLL